MSDNEEQKNKIGRPSDYSLAIAERICEKIATQRYSLERICNENEEFPHASTAYRWLGEHKEFRELYALAKERQADSVRDEALDCAYDDQHDTQFTDKGPMPNHEWINRSKLKVDTLKWLGEKLSPRKYGTKIDLTTDGKELGTGTDLTKLSLEELLELKKKHERR